MRLSFVPSLRNVDGRELLGSLLPAHVDKRGDVRYGDSIMGSDGVLRAHKRLGDR